MSGTTETFADETDADRAFDELVDRVTALLQAGQEVDLAQFEEASPQHFARLKRLIPTIQAAAHLAEKAAGTTTRDAAGQVLGDYEIVREIGRGGMGIVYEARQLSLGRTVALKVLPHAVTLDPRQLARFKNEARAAATLEHPHIVPVFGVGCEQHVHYYAMQLIKGRNLAQVMSDTKAGLRNTAIAEAGAAAGPLGAEHVRWAATLGKHIAEALHHAHEHGVVHRDVKPSNLLVDLQGKVWVTDFGLARIQADMSMTMTGDRVGTARYMSPEQARGQGALVSHRSDIYSLGVTFYELLALRPAFAGEDQQALLYEVIHGQPPRPRSVNRLIPVDIETIVLKAMAKDPADRYASAGELADDLRRFLEQRPILARRPSWGIRLHKWLLRHRTISLTIAAAAVCLIITLSIAAGMISRGKQRITLALDDAEWNLNLANVAAQRERDMALEARQTVNDMYTRVASEWLSGEPQLQKLQHEFLEKALRFYQRLARDYADDEAAQADVAQAQFRVGEIQRGLGHLEQAGAAYQAAADAYAALDRRHPDPAVRVELARTYQGIGHIQERERYTLGEQWYQKAIDLMEEVVKTCPENADYRSRLAYSIECLAWCYVSTGRFPQAVETERRALDHVRALPLDYPTRERSLIFGASDMADWLYDCGKTEEAEKIQREVIPKCRELPQNAPRDHRLRYALARALERHAQALIGLRRYEEALAEYQEILAVRKSLTGGFPDIESYNDSYIFERHRYGQLLKLMHRTSEAERVYQETIDLAQQPQFAHTKWVYAELCRDLGTILHEAGKLKDAKQCFSQALAFYEPYARSCPNNCFVQSQFAWFLANFPDLELRDTARAVQLATHAVEQVPTSGMYQHILGVALYRAGRWTEAIAALDRSTKLREGGDAADYFFLAMSHYRLGQNVLARQWNAKAIEWMQQSKPGDGDLQGFRAEAQALVMPAAK